MRFRRLSDKRCLIFDLDDTLVKSESKVIVTNGSTTKMLTPANFAAYTPKPGDTFDYSQFKKLVNPKLIAWTTKIFTSAIRKYQNTDNDVYILSARDSKGALIEFLNMLDIPYHPQIIALGTAAPLAKANWIEKNIIPQGYGSIECFDDAITNINEYSRLKEQYKDSVKFTIHHVGFHGKGNRSN